MWVSSCDENYQLGRRPLFLSCFSCSVVPSCVFAFFMKELICNALSRASLNVIPMVYSIHTSENLIWFGLTSLVILTSSVTLPMTWWYFIASQQNIEFIFKMDWRTEELSSFCDWNTEMHYLINQRLVWIPRNLEYLALQFGLLFPVSSNAAAHIL